MSKAFVNEDALAEPAGERLPQRPAQPLPITRRGADDLEHELEAIDPTGRRAHAIRQILDTVVISEPAADGGSIAFGSAVDVRRANGMVRSYELVGPDEADPRSGRISIAAPIGRALLGARTGDAVTVQRPEGEETVVVVNVGT